MKRIYLVLAVLAMSLALAAGMTGCGGKDDEPASSGGQEDSEVESMEETDETESNKADGNESLVVYFSFPDNADVPDDVDAESSASIIKEDGKIIGNAGLMARWISEETGSKLYPIETKEKYPADYDTTVDQARDEQTMEERPALKGKIKDFDKYKVFYIVYPNWWYDLPMPLYTFFDEYDFSGKTLILYATHGGSGFSDTVDTVKKLEPKAEVVQGLDVYYSDVEDSEEQIKARVKKDK